MPHGPESVEKSVQRDAVPPGLHLVSSPIGNARDITLRALDVLSCAEVLVAEDTRTLRRLMRIHSIPLRGRKLLAYHDHNGAKQRPKILEHLKEGRSVAYVPDAGTPMISDPGFKLAKETTDHGILVNVVPGPSAVTAALCASGLETDRFLFGGFLPAQRAARKRALETLRPTGATLVLFESPKRLVESLEDIAALFGPARPVAVCRELTKKFEDISRGAASDLAEKFRGTTTRGEIVVIVGRSGEPQADATEIRCALKDSMERLSLRDAVAEVTEMHGMPKKDVYRIALSIRNAADLDKLR